MTRSCKQGFFIKIYALFVPIMSVTHSIYHSPFVLITLTEMKSTDYEIHNAFFPVPPHLPMNILVSSYFT